MAEIKFTFGTALAKPNGLDISLSMIKSKQANVPLYSLAKSCTYLVERKNVITSFINSKSLLQIASKKANAS